MTEISPIINNIKRNLDKITPVYKNTQCSKKYKSPLIKAKLDVIKNVKISKDKKDISENAKIIKKKVDNFIDVINDCQCDYIDPDNFDDTIKTSGWLTDNFDNYINKVLEILQKSNPTLHDILYNDVYTETKLNTFGVGKTTQEKLKHTPQEKIQILKDNNEIIKSVLQSNPKCKIISKQKITNKSQEKITNKSQEKITNKSQEKITNKSQEKITNKSQEKITNKSQEKITNKSQENTKIKTNKTIKKRR